MSTNQPITSGATTTTVSQGISGVRIRSPRGLLAALTFLLGIPLSFGWQILFGSGAGTMVHFVLAAGTLLLAFCVFDFELPRWMNWIGCAAGLALGSIFLFASCGSSDTERDAELLCLRGVGAMAGRMVARCTYPLVSRDVGTR